MRFRSFCRYWIFGVLLLLGALSVPAPAGASERGRVVLVLSGGGARGAAHVGVLRWLERERIPIDSIVGTSMGSIIGGLYASGLTADELGQVIRGIDWVDAFDDEPARKHLTYRRKRDDDDFLVDIGLGFRDGEARMPRGIIQAQKLNLYLRELALPVATARNFDALPTPFRAVAADLGSGDTVILQRGDLASAMRASMSAPGVFAPAEIDGRILVDGGVAMNLPIEVARNWGADVIIAVDVGSGPVPVEDLDSALAVTNQMLDILIERETREQRALLTPRDVLVRPQLGDIGSTDFLLAEPAMEAGLVAAEAARVALKQYAVSEAEYDAFVRRRLAERAVLAGGPVDAPPQRVPAFVVLETDADVDPDLITAQMATAPGAPLSIAKLREDLARIYGLGLFEQVDYRWTESDEGEGIVVDARARSWGPGYLAFGLAYEEGFEGSSNFSVSARALRTALNRLGGEWRTNVTLGTDLRLQSEFYQPLSVARRWFIAPQIDAFQRNIRAFENEEAVARYRLTTSEASVAVGREISNVAELRFGVFRGDGDARVKVGSTALSDVDVTTGGARLTFGFDTLDDTLFPRRGQRLGFRVDFARTSLGARRNYETWRASLDTYWSFGRHTLAIGFDAATSDDADDIIEETNFLGGFLNLSGLDRGAVVGPHAGVARIVYHRRTGRIGQSLLDWPLYFGGSLEAGNAWARRADINSDSLILNASAFVRVDTLLGPVYLAGGFGESGESSIYLFIGASPD